MKQIIKVAVIGGAGKSGKYVVRQLISRGFHIKLLLRNPADFLANGSLQEIIKGNVRDYPAVCALMQGCQAVISTLGQPKGESAIFSQATENIIKAMNEFSMQRYIVTTGLSVDAAFDNKNIKAKFASEWMMENYPETTIDKQKEYNILLDSPVNWTLVRLPLIEQTDERSQIIARLDDCPGDKISSANLAHFLAEQLTDDHYIKKSPFIANG